MDYVKPHDVVKDMVSTGALKLDVPASHLVIRGALAGAYLGIATSMAVTAAVEIEPNAERVQVPLGEEIVLRIDSDAPGELHVHPRPEQYADFEAGRPTARPTIEAPGLDFTHALARQGLAELIESEGEDAAPLRAAAAEALIELGVVSR